MRPTPDTPTWAGNGWLRDRLAEGGEDLELAVDGLVGSGALGLRGTGEARGFPRSGVVRRPEPGAPPRRAFRYAADACGEAVARVCADAAMFFAESGVR